MTTGRVLVGLVLGAVALGSVGAGSLALRRRLLSGWQGAPGRLAEIVIALSIVICTLELLGLVSLYRFLPAVLGLGAAGAAALIVARWRAEDLRAPAERPPVPASVVGRAGALITVATTALLAGAWGTRTADGVHHGMQTVDSLWYHMPVAARFAQEHSITAVHYVDAGPVTAFFPANSPLVHGLGILLLGNDSLSPLLNLAWLALALLAAWCIGRPYGVAPLTLTGVAIVATTPGLVATQPGGAYTDIVGLALLLAAVAMLVNAHAAVASRPPVAAVGIAALAAGAALGTKFTLLAPVAGLSLAAVVLAPAGSRVRHGALWIAGLVATGAVWYVRNLFVAGNPLPELKLGIGGFALPALGHDQPTFSVAQYLFDGRIWSDYYLPGLDRSLGPAWWGVVGLAIAGYVAGVLFTRTRLQRALAFVGCASFIAFLLTPQFLGIEGAPVFFVFNVRYATPALALGLVVLPTVPALARKPSAWFLLGSYFVILLATQLDPTIWPTDLGVPRFAEPIRHVDFVVGVLAGVVVLGVGLLVLVSGAQRRHPWPRRAWALVALGGLVAVLVAGVVLRPVSQHARYVSTPPFPATYEWAQDLHDARIGVVGPLLQAQYPLYGKDLSSYVQYVGERRPHGDFEPLADCARWRMALNRGHYDYVVISDPRARQWTEHDPAVQRPAVGDQYEDDLTGRVSAAVYRLDGRLSRDGCPAAGRRAGGPRPAGPAAG